MTADKKKDVPDKEDNKRYKYHQSQMNEDKDENTNYDKPKNHTSTEERLLNPDKGNK